MTYTEKELDQFLHGISLSLLSKKSAQHWRYDEETAKEIEWLEALERKVRADKADRKTEPTISKMEQVERDCTGCKFIGTYDTEFPCANCSRKTKDYYAKDEPQTDCQDCKYAWWNGDAKRYECTAERCQYEDEQSGKRGRVMDIVKMERNCLGDTRTATHMPTREEFREANWSHKDDVLNLAVAFATELRSRVGNHDWTKVQAPYDEMFYDLMKATIEDGADFMDGEWARLHYDVLERHHLSRHCPNDVTLFDVLEMLFDCVSAGMTRSGSVYPIDISDEILQKAVSNTVDYLVKHIEVVDRKDEPQTIIGEQFSSYITENNCEHITEDGVTCAKYPACDDCPDNPLNKIKGSERLVKGSERSSDVFNA